MTSLLPILLLLPRANALESTIVPLSLLLREEPEQPAEPPERWSAASAHYALTPGAGALYVEATIQLDPIAAGWVEAPLLDGRVMLESEAPGVIHGADGRWWYVGWLERPTRIQLAGEMAAAEGQATLAVAPAARQSVEGIGDGVVVQVAGAAAGLLSPTDSLSITWGPEVPDRPVTTVLQARSITAARVEDGALAAAATLRWSVRRGESASFTASLPGPTAELEVTGPPAMRWERRGDQIVLTPAEPESGTFEIDLTWRVPLDDEGEATLRPPEPLGAISTDAWLTLGSDGEQLLIPAAGGGLRATSIRALPEWAQGLGQGTSAWSGQGPLALKAVEITPLEGPPLVVDRARCEEASAQGGRALLRCQLDVRNDSRQFLGVAAPEGFRLWTARVNGEPVSPVRDADGTLRVPLERSVETLEGLTALDVDLTFGADRAPWTRRGQRQATLPAFDAPVAVLEWTLRPPPGYRARPVAGTVRAPDEDAETEQIVYGLAAVSEDTRETWNQALDAYQDNRFEDAQSLVDDLIAQDPSYENALRLKSNLDVLIAPEEDEEESANRGPEDAATRRVRELARAKDADLERAQAEALVTAQAKLQSGDVEAAVEDLKKVEEMSRQLAYTEQTESGEQSWYRDQVAAAYESAEAQGRLLAGRDSGSRARNERERDKRDDETRRYPASSSSSSSSRASGGDDGVVYKQRTEIDFEDVEISGELVMPQGAELVVPQGAYVLEGVGGGGSGGLSPSGSVAAPVQIVEEYVAEPVDEPAWPVAAPEPPPPPPAAAPEPEPEPVFEEEPAFEEGQLARVTQDRIVIREDLSGVSPELVAEAEARIAEMEALQAAMQQQMTSYQQQNSIASEAYAHQRAAELEATQRRYAEQRAAIDATLEQIVDELAADYAEATAEPMVIVQGSEGEDGWPGYDANGYLPPAGHAPLPGGTYNEPISEEISGAVGGSASYEVLDTDDSVWPGYDHGPVALESYGEIGGEEYSVVGGVEGGVVGGVVGGVLGGEVGGQPAGTSEIPPEEIAQGQVLTKEFLERIPTGRDYHSALTTTPGVAGQPDTPPESPRGRLLQRDPPEQIPTGQAYIDALTSTPGVIGSGNPNVAGGAYNENTYLLDGANVTDPAPTGDPVTGTFSLNFDYDAIDSTDTASADRESERFDAIFDEENAPTATMGDALEVPAEPEPASAQVDFATSASQSRVQAVQRRSALKIPAPRRGGRADAPPPPVAAPAAVPPPATIEETTGVVVTNALVEPDPAPPPLRATTLAIPVPNSGDPLQLTQQLLNPGEQPTVTLRYREEK